MRDIINATLCENHFLKCDTYTIARNGEGLTPCLSVSIPDSLREFWVYINFEKSNGEKFITPRIDLTDGKIVYNIPSAVLDVDGLLGVQIEFKKDNGATWKSYTKEFAVRRSINAVDDIPEKEDFLAEAQKILDKLKDVNPNKITGDFSVTDEYGNTGVELSNGVISGYQGGGDYEINPDHIQLKGFLGNFKLSTTGVDGNDTAKESWQEWLGIQSMIDTAIGQALEGDY